MPEGGQTRNYAKQFLGGIFSQDACNWCRDREEKIVSTKLCSSCYRAKRKIVNLESDLKLKKDQGRRATSALRFTLTVAREAATLLKEEGAQYGNLDSKEISGLDIEREFSKLSERFVGKDLYWGDANLFSWSFSPDQRCLLRYLLSKIERKYMQRHRHSIASNRAVTRTK